MKIEIDSESNIWTLRQDIEEIIEAKIESADLVKADKIGLDPRAGKVYVFQDEQTIAVKKGHNQRSLEYYGGFEYIDEDCKFEVGDYVFYEDCDRVLNALDYFAKNKG